LLKFDEEDETFMVDGLEEAGGVEGPMKNLEGAGDLGWRREGCLATLSAEIGIHYPLAGMTDSGLTIIGPPGRRGLELGSWSCTPRSWRRMYGSTL
jgi:hypothetical protein